MAKKPHILIIYTGGTIGMVVNYKTSALKTFNFENIYKNIPELKLLNCSISSVSFENPIDSSNMNISYWNKIADFITSQYDKVDGFVILHGSDTMSYTASVLSFMLEGLAKPVIFTGSQLPIGDLRTDAKENMITAIEIASTYKDDKPLIQEVCIYFEYKLYRGNRTTKTSAEQFEAFSSPNFPALAQSGVHLKFNKNIFFYTKKKQFKTTSLKNNNIILIKLYPGITEEVVRHILNTPNLKGVVLAAYGSGNAPTNKWFINLLKNTLKKGIPIIDITQCVAGSVALGKYETSAELLKLGLISGYDITTEAAIGKLLYLLSTNTKDLKTAFETPLRGEIS